MPPEMFDSDNYSRQLHFSEKRDAQNADFESRNQM